MTTNRAPVPKHEQIADTYRRKIKAGELAPGDKMPTIREVQAEWGVSRTTAERAMGELRREGLTVARRRTGTVVATLPPPVMTGLARLERLIRTGSTHADGETSERLRPPALRSCYDPHIAEQLGVELGDEIVLRIRLFRQDGKPTAIGLSCIHPRALALVPELLDDEQLPKFWQLLYAERGGEAVEGGEHEFFRARNASADELAAFGIDVPDDVNVPVMYSNTTFHTSEGPIEVWEDVYAPWTVKAVPRKASAGESSAEDDTEGGAGRESLPRP